MFIKTVISRGEVADKTIRIKGGPMLKGRRKPKSILINPKFQISFLTQHLLLAAVSSLIMFATVQYQFNKFDLAGKEMKLSEGHFYFQLLNQQHQDFNTMFVYMGIINFLILVFAGFRLSHRVAGPLHRLKVHSERVIQGETTTELRFRKGDYFQDVAEAYNKQLHFRKPRSKASGE